MPAMNSLATAKIVLLNRHHGDADGNNSCLKKKQILCIRTFNENSFVSNNKIHEKYVVFFGLENNKLDVTRENIRLQ